MDSDSINVVVRMRPHLERDAIKVQFLAAGPNQIISNDESKSWTFDRVIDEEANNSDVYRCGSLLS